MKKLLGLEQRESSQIVDMMAPSMLMIIVEGICLNNTMPLEAWGIIYARISGTAWLNRRMYQIFLHLAMQSCLSV